MSKRGFAIVEAFKDKGINLPQRKTAASAGYDLEAAEDTVIAPGGRAVIATGLKVYMQDDEFLAIHIRSSLAFKQNLMLLNSVGVIDADYYNNPDNEGHIMIGLYNFGSEGAVISKGTRIAQGIFYNYLKVDGEEDVTETRQGGFGSTGV